MRNSVPDASFTETAVVGQDYTIAKNPWTIKGYYFVRWNTKADGTGDKYSPGDVILVEGPMTLYAIWCACPIALDLDGTGFQTTSLDNGVVFDYDGNGNAVRTSWISSGEGLLVRDLNGNGTIDNGSELLGSFTILPNGEQADNGFQALAGFDLNKDGIVDGAEAQAAGLLIWKDANGNGVADPGELLTFAQAGVAGIETGYAESSDVDANGNLLRWQGAFIRSDGSKALAVDVLFVTEPMNQ